MIQGVNVMKLLLFWRVDAGKFDWFTLNESACDGAWQDGTDVLRYVKKRLKMISGFSHAATRHAFVFVISS